MIENDCFHHQHQRGEDQNQLECRGWRGWGWRAKRILRCSFHSGTTAYVDFRHGVGTQEKWNTTKDSPHENNQLWDIWVSTHEMVSSIVLCSFHRMPSAQGNDFIAWQLVRVSNLHASLYFALQVSHRCLHTMLYAAHSWQNPLRRLAPTRALLTAKVHGPPLKQYRKALGSLKSKSCFCTSQSANDYQRVPQIQTWPAYGMYKAVCFLEAPQLFETSVSALCLLTIPQRRCPWWSRVGAEGCNRLTHITSKSWKLIF